MKKVITILVVASLVIASFLLATAKATDSTDSSQQNFDQTKSFLSNVMGLDLTKYSLTTSPYQLKHNITQPPDSPPQIPSGTDGLIMQTPSYYFKSESGTIGVLSIFYNGQLAVVNIYSIDKTYSYIYTTPPKTDLTNQASILLTRYEDFLTQKDAADITFLAPMKDILGNANIQSSANITVGNINFQSSHNGNVTKLQWIYTEDGIAMNWKRVELDFYNDNLFSFTDYWSIYKVSGLNAISAEQATKIALDAAQNVTLNITDSNGKIALVETPDLSNARYDVQFNMLPCQSFDTNIASKSSLDPLTLYPLWQFHFYFNQTIAGDEGIQVGVLGDTSQVLYAGPFGYLGTPPTPAPTGTSDTTADSPGLLILIAVIATVILIVFIPIALRHKIRQRK